MAKSLTKKQWEKVNTLLRDDGARFGLPKRRRNSFVLASFNIRKLGKVKNKSAGSWEFLRQFCDLCDLVAIQEVQDDLSGMAHLRDLVNAATDDAGYGLVASDATGWGVSTKSIVERLAFLYRRDRVERTEVCADLTFDRTKVLNRIFEGRAAFIGDLEQRIDALARWETKNEDRSRKTKKPPFVLSNFLTFIRTPLCCSFRIHGKAGSEPYEFLAVTAHLLYGDRTKQKQEREMEFYALLEWLVSRAKAVKNLYHKNLILLGDLNLDFTKADERRDVIQEKIKSLNEGELRSKNAATVDFPFFDVHPGAAAVFRSTARLTETYDQIAFFNHDDRLPTPEANDHAGSRVDGFDYGVFNFTDLFAEALHGKPFAELTKQQRKDLIARYEHDVSDHLPIWVRLPRPE